MTTTTEHDAGTARLRRLGWRSRRGLLELELVLAPFALGALGSLNSAELDAYEALLENDDLDLYDWLMGRTEPPAEHAPIVASIGRFLTADAGSDGVAAKPA